ncbi:hypothetical protein SCLCIDRAFT_1222154 [Scleroderma citrinum Foug A]|uniref:Uncharacterized protein n=1 Tax=Scleroderma citrinum Foug A TaxID=1036808 RepID=A0A0C3DDW6_9AGAM|nr:hypothetical protein SCLCIDRAFT_1222154 [Scleroderma citrinum Foug A]
MMMCSTTVTNSVNATASRSLYYHEPLLVKLRPVHLDLVHHAAGRAMLKIPLPHPPAPLQLQNAQSCTNPLTYRQPGPSGQSFHELGLRTVSLSGRERAG